MLRLGWCYVCYFVVLLFDVVLFGCGWVIAGCLFGVNWVHDVLVGVFVCGVFDWCFRGLVWFLG